MEYLSVVDYFFGMGGLLLIIVGIVGLLFWHHVKEQDLRDPVIEAMALFYIGLMLGLVLLFISIPTLCFIRSTYLCYQVM